MILNKRFLLGLIAIASLSAYACDDDDDSDKCTAGEKKACANANTAVMCVNGEWKNVSCGENSSCNPTSRECVANGTSGGGTSGGGTSGGGTSGGGTSGGGTSGGSTLAACATVDAGQSCSACTPVCSSDGSTAYLCNASKGTTMKWTCANNDCAVDASGSVTCSKSSSGGGSTDVTVDPSIPKAGDACTYKSSEAKCSTDKSYGVICGSSNEYYNYTCKNNDCVVCDGFLKCGECSSSSGGGSTDVTVDPSIPKAGDACTYKTSEAKCSTDKSYGVICGSSNEYYNYTCKENNCVVCDGFLKCGECTSSSTTEDCTASSTAKCTAACSSDNKAGYYWKTDHLETVDCSEKSNCTLDGKYVQCGATVTCDEANNKKGTCSADGATAEVCYGGKMVTWDCYNNQCSVDASGIVTCAKDPSTYSSDCNGDKTNRATSGGAVNDCCDPEKYEPAGCVSNAGLRCSSDGIIKEWTCTKEATPVCSYNAATKYYSCVAK